MIFMVEQLITYENCGLAWVITPSLALKPAPSYPKHL